MNVKMNLIYSIPKQKHMDLGEIARSYIGCGDEVFFTQETVLDISVVGCKFLFNV